MHNVSNLTSRINQISRELADRRRALELAEKDESISDAQYLNMEDAVYDLEAELADLEDELSEASQHETPHGWN